MTLDEAIKHAEEVADAKLQDAELSEIQGCYNNAKKCVQCAKEHRQLAEWLKDYKRLKEQDPYDFAKWVATQIFDEMWEYNADAFAELACRRLAKLGIVKADGGKWELIEPQESEG